MTVIVAELIGRSDPALDVLTTELNQMIQDQAADWSTGTSQVLTVDMYTGFDPATMTGDGVHPNATGERFMADRWMGAIEAIPGVPEPSSAMGLLVGVGTMLVRRRRPAVTGRCRACPSENR